MLGERLSKPLHELLDHYTVVIVGSGYGGSIAASRLARAGQSVCLLERGRELQPGEYPRTTAEGLGQLQIGLGDHQIGDRRNLYTFHVGDDVTVFSGTGLGGTSLLNASVAMRPAEWVLDDAHWPAALRADRSGMHKGYERAEEMLRPTRYPDSYPPLAKIDALQRSAGGSPFQRTPINVTFRSGVNHVGVYQEACNGCGDCTTGCNYRSKNTLLMNYLPDAVQHGAHVFAEVDVDRVERLDDRWVVRYQPLGTGRATFDAPPLTVTADIVIVAAGTVGSNGIMLRSRREGLTTSDHLGTRFTGNGDALGYSYARKSDVDGIGAGDEAPDRAHLPGPCITAIIDEREVPREYNGVVIEDAVIPGVLASVISEMLAPQAVGAWFRRRLRHPGGPLSLLWSSLTRGRRGPIARTQTFLLMGHDDDQGRIVLDGDQPQIEWSGANERGYYDYANERMAQAARDSGGTYLHSPVWTKTFRDAVVTVHPLGGCFMADTADEGVVDERGRVFAGTSGTAVHDGLYVCDGSVVPLPLGINPLLTISALAERNIALLAADRGWSIDYGLDHPPLDGPDATTEPSAPPGPPPTPPPAPPPDRPGLRFTEKMAGWFSLGDQGVADTGTFDVDTFAEAATAGEAADSPMSFVLTLASDDARAVTARLDTPMEAIGTVAAPALSPEPLTVENGEFQLLAADDPDPEIRHMWYRLPLAAVDGTHYHFAGFKIVGPGDAADAWPDMTTLHVTVRRDDDTGPVVGRGILKIAKVDFARQMSTMRVTGPVGALERMHLLTRFTDAVGGEVVRDYLSVVQRTSRMKRNAPPRVHRPLRVPIPELHPYRSDDGVDLRLTRYQGGDRGPVVVSHGMGANPLTFSTDTIETNALEYLVEHGFDVWIQEWRGSTLLPSSHTLFNQDDVALRDHPAAEQVVRDVTGRDELHWVTHCIGSVTVTMATLAGTITPASLLCSQVAAHPIGPAIMKLKVRLHLAGLLRRLGVRFLTSDSYDDEKLRSRMFDALLHLYPVPKEEECDQQVCRRLAFIYGNAVHHSAVNGLTHVNLHELFGTTNLEGMQHLSEMAGAERVIAADGSDAYLPHLERLRIPLTLLHGAHNRVWVPESTKRTYDTLVNAFGPEQYRRIVFADYGHQDTFMGEHAVDDAYPAMLEHLDRAGA